MSGGIDKKLVNRNIVIALGVVCIIALAGLVGTYFNYTSIISSKDSSITTLNSQITSLQSQTINLQNQITSLQSQLGIVRSLPTLNLTLIGATGQTKVLNSSSIAVLTAITAKGGTRSNSGTLANYGNYTGIPILTLLNLVGGVTSNNTVKITASDNFISTLTYAQVNGQGITTYNSNGNQTTPTLPLTMIIAYYYNGAPLASGLGPLRIAVVGTEGLYSSGSIWAKMAIKIQII